MQKKTVLRLMYLLLATALGVFFIVFGGYDDSPGAQMLGVLLIVAAVILFIRKTKINRVFK